LSLPARLLSALRHGWSDFRSARGRDGEAAPPTAAERRIDERLAKIEADIATLRGIVLTQEERTYQALRAGFSSAANLLSILPDIKIEGVLPAFPHHGFEITGELAAYLFHLVRRHRPKVVMELGSGSSTLILAGSLRATGGGRLITVEHDPKHRVRTERLLEQTELSSWVELIEAPLKEQAFGAHKLQWYDLGRRLDSLPHPIDLLFVDGPPGKVQPLSRYPALPVLLPYLAPDAHIVIDDGVRADEMHMVELWRELGAPFEVETLDFLPRAPFLIRMAMREARAAEQREARRSGAS
jgi:predicted O-methyltransferase YrrM